VLRGCAVVRDVTSGWRDTQGGCSPPLLLPVQTGQHSNPTALCPVLLACLLPVVAVTTAVIGMSVVTVHPKLMLDLHNTTL